MVLSPNHWTLKNDRFRSSASSSDASGTGRTLHSLRQFRHLSPPFRAETHRRTSARTNLTHPPRYTQCRLDPFTHRRTVFSLTLSNPKSSATVRNAPSTDVLACPF